jgi:hypothetical protein
MEGILVITRVGHVDRDPSGCRTYLQTPPPYRTLPHEVLRRNERLLFHGMVIAPKIIRLKEQENSAAALITDKTFLPLVRRTSQQNIAVAFRVGRDDHPAFTRLRRILYEGKPQLVCVVLNGAIVVINHNSHAAEASFLCSHFSFPL